MKQRRASLPEKEKDDKDGKEKDKEKKEEKEDKEKVEKEKDKENHKKVGSFRPRFTQANYPKCSMYGIFTYIYPKNDPNVGKYSIHGASGMVYPPKTIEFTAKPASISL